MPSPTSRLMSSTPASDLWRPTGDRLTYADVGWTGAAWGVAMHATLSFFSVAMPTLRPLVALFAPAERFAFAITEQAAPMARWLVLITVQAVFWALVGIAALAAWREIEALVRKPRRLPDTSR